MWEEVAATMIELSKAQSSLTLPEKVDKEYLGLHYSFNYE